MITCAACGKENPDGFQFCGFCGAPLSAAAVAPLRERKVVSVLFCDLVGFTAASEQADPEEVQARLAPYHARTRERIEAYGGTVEKFIGDAVMAVFGAPVTHEDDPERAVRAGLSVLEAIEDLNASDNSLALSVRVGVNTGQALVALDARPTLGEGMVTGDVVNTAARIQAHGPVNGVAVGEGTFRATERVFEYQRLEPVMAKGKTDPVAMWQAMKPTARFGSDVIRSMSARMVGRELDLALLRGTFDKVVAESSTHLVTIAGEPGVGKSRLVTELFAHVDGLQRIVRWRQGRCLPYGEGITFWAVGEILKAHAGIYETDSPEIAREKLDAVLPASEDRPWLRARLLPLLGLDSGAAAAHEELFAAWRRFFESIAERDPLVLVVEDIHWADPAMLAFLEHLADWSQGVPLLVVCTARPELYKEHATWAAALRNTTTISLSPLSDRDTATLVGALLEHAVLPLETQQLLLERAGGNPLYAEEFVRMLRDRDLLDERGTLRTDANVPFPESIQALVASRLDTLTPERKSLLQDAAVIGKVFWSGAVIEMGKREPHDVEAALHELARNELVRPARSSSMQGEAEYGFWHVLIRDVCYAQMPRATRAARHRAAAAWIEGKAGERVEDLADVLAYHYLEALELSRATGTSEQIDELEAAARRTLGLAGARALALDVASAEASLAQALAFAPAGHAERAGLLEHWARAAQQQGRLQEAKEALEEAFALNVEAGESVVAGRVLVTLMTVLWGLGDPRRLEVVAQALVLLEAQPPGPELVAAHAALAGAHFIGSLYPEAIAEANRTLQLAADLELPEPARALGFRGGARCFLGDRQGLNDMRRALELSLAQGDSRGAGVLLANLMIATEHFEGPQAAVDICREGLDFCERRGIAELALAIAAEGLPFLAECGRVDEALTDAEPLLERAEALGSVVQAIHARSLQLRLLVLRGQRRSEPGIAERLAAAARGTGVPEHAVVGFAGAAQLLLAERELNPARELLAELAAIPGVRSDQYYGSYLPQLVRCALALGDPALAAELVEDVPPSTPLITHSLATVQAALTEPLDAVEAASLYADVAKSWQEFGNLIEQAHALLGQGRCLLLGEANADVPLLQARSLFDEMGATPRVEQCDTLIEQASNQRAAGGEVA